MLTNISWSIGGGPYSTLNSGWIEDVAYHIGRMWPGTYKWRVKSRGSNGLESAWSDTWSFKISHDNTFVPTITTAPTLILPTTVPTILIPSTVFPTVTLTPIPSTATSVPQSGYVVLLENLLLRTEGGSWPPTAGEKLIAHIKIQNGGDLPIHIEHIGVRGRRNGSDTWDIGFWTIELNGRETWSFDPNNERPLTSGNYSFRISYSLNGSDWQEIGNEINFTVP